jgi:hypothetical protein
MPFIVPFYFVNPYNSSGIVWPHISSLAGGSGWLDISISRQRRETVEHFMRNVQTRRNAQTYQLALTTPGISPREASSRKQILQIWNLLMYPLGLPQILHLLYLRTLNLGGLEHFIISEVFAIISP